MHPLQDRRLRVAALLTAWLPAACGAPESGLPSGKGLNVLLISIDTLRADHLGCYGYRRPTSPNLDAFAAESVRFAQAITQAPWTTPSHMTLMTALYPSSHGVDGNFLDLASAKPGKRRFRVLSPDRITLAQVLRGAGYETLALTGGATVSADLGFGQGFDEFVEPRAGSTFWGSSEQVWNQLRQWLGRDHTRPFFLFFHTFEAHAPYAHSALASSVMNEGQRESMRELLTPGKPDPLGAQKGFLIANQLYNRQVTEALYDGGIRFVDSLVGRLFNELKQRGLYDRTMIVVVSDHGETFGEHNPTFFYNAHGWSQYEDLIHVPLLVRFPPTAGHPRVATQPVGLIDVAPTILAALGLRIPDAMQGKSRARLLVEDTDDYGWTVSEANSATPRVLAWREDRYKYIATFAVPAGGDPSFIPGPLLGEELYDLLADPGETRNLAHDEREQLTAKRRLLLRHFELLKNLGLPAQPKLMTLDQGLERDLKALGYL